MENIDDWTFLAADDSLRELEGRLGDYLGGNGLDIVPVSLGTPEDPMTSHEGPDTDTEGEHLAQMPGVMEIGHSHDPRDPEEEPPPPAVVRRLLQDRMRELGRTLMIAGGKSPRQQMMDIQGVLEGLFGHLEALSDQPGREAFRRRILMQVRPHVMRF